MTSNSQGSSQADPLVVTKLREIGKLEKRIGDLQLQADIIQAQLEQMRTEKDHLEQELAIIRDSASTTPIRRLPIEIFLYIFKELLHGENIESERWKASRKIADLMIVCKSWHNIVINSPTLWTTICIKLKDGVVNRENLARQLQYVQTFMEHSKEIPVNVSIDLSRLSSGKEYVEKHLYTTISSLDKADFEEYYDGDDDDDDYYDSLEPSDALFNWFSELHWQDCPLVDPYERLCGRFLGVVAGENGGHVKRWNSLYLALPSEHEFGSKMLEYIDFKAPLLRALHLSSWRVPSDIWKNHSLQTLATLDRIRLDGEPTFSLIPESYGAQQLEIFNIGSLHGVDFLNHFSNLRYLRLQPLGSSPDLIVRPIRLPHLQHLRLGGDVPDSFFQSFETARLPKLSLDYLEDSWLGNRPYPIANLFQVVNLVFITIELYAWSDVSYRVSHAVSMLPGLFKQLSSTITIGVEDSLLAEVSSVITHCKANGELPELRSLVQVDDDGEITSRAEYATFMTSFI